MSFIGLHFSRVQVGAIIWFYTQSPFKVSFIFRNCLYKYFLKEKNHRGAYASASLLLSSVQVLVYFLNLTHSSLLKGEEKSSRKQEKQASSHRLLLAPALRKKENKQD